MNKATKALIWCAALMIASEVGIRTLESGPIRVVDDAPSFETRRPFVFVLGTSRVRRGIWPRVIEKAWAEETGHRPWVASIWELAVTNIGLYKIYLDEIRPWAKKSTIPNGVLAIEICGASMNDSYMRDEEARYAHVSTFGKHLRAGDLSDASSQLLVSSARFTEIKGIIEDRFGKGERQEEIRIEDGEKMEDNGESAPQSGKRKTSLAQYLHRYSWGRGYKGFDPHHGTMDDLRLEKIREQYTGTLLKDYALGGIQIKYLKKLVKSAREDGLKVVFFILPITADHREFWDGDMYAAYVAAAEEVAAELGVPLHNFDRDFEISPDEFRDTNHLKEVGAVRLSREFASRLLGDGLVPEAGNQN